MKTNEETYRDRWLDRVMIHLLTAKLSKAVGKDTALQGYAGLVDVSKQLMQQHDAETQQAVVGNLLRSLIPAFVLALIRTLVPPTRRILEWNAWFASQWFEWLVGPCALQTVEVIGVNGEVRTQRSGVQIKKCRYLEQSGCVGMCVNLCKLPTQTFFAQEFGFPLTMTPNFEDLSCEMAFGRIAPSIETEPVYDQPCLVAQCDLAAPRAVACPQVRSG